MSDERRTGTTDCLPRIEDWRLDPDVAMPPCPKCGGRLGITPAWLSVTRRDEWTCDYCGVMT